MTSARSENISSYSVTKRVAIAHEVGQELSVRKLDEAAREDALRIAESLVNDWCQQVREALAFELRHCRKLPKLVACKIACDVDEIAVPFLRVTPALSDAWAAELVPLLSDNAHLALAVRTDLGPQTAREIAFHGGERSAVAIAKNAGITLTPSCATTLVEIHENSTVVMETLATRADLPASVVASIIGKISSTARAQLVTRYNLDTSLAQELTDNSAHTALWKQLRHASPAQMHAQVINLKSEGKLTDGLILAVAERGAVGFLESALALRTGKTLISVREAFNLTNQKLFVDLLRGAQVSEELAPRFLKVAKKHYSSRSAKRAVGKPAMWQAPANVNTPDQGDELHQSH
ncbi:MAG: DUF2336 domain-containing protein [Alphaproteobacteria bacterium]|nr:DUF2336 domain-containing protein [Alphaproteobacteria bacterium]